MVVLKAVYENMEPNILIIFKNYNPQKVSNDLVIDDLDDFFIFFHEDNKQSFKAKALLKLSESRWFYIDYYNKEWEYQDYEKAGLAREGFTLGNQEILLYQKYADNFNCPKPVLDKAWQWYRENDYTFMGKD